METINLNQLISDEGGTYLLGEAPFSGFAIEAFPDGSLLTQMSLMHGRQDGITRGWHPNGQLESEKSFRDGLDHGTQREWRPDGVLKTQSHWNAGACAKEWRFDERGWLIQEIRFRQPGDPEPVMYRYDLPDEAAVAEEASS